MLAFEFERKQPILDVTVQLLPIVLVLAQWTADKTLLETVLLPLVHALATKAVLALLALLSIDHNVLADSTNEVLIKFCLLLLLVFSRATVRFRVDLDA